MKFLFLSVVAIVFIGFTVKQMQGGSARSSKSIAANSATINGDSAKGFAVIELFTSEGCSSCPPADALLAKLESEKMMDVFILSYHVDYWNRLGWKDVYSKPEWTARQATYAKHFNLESVYTPQVVVNGRAEFVGSDKPKLYSFLKDQLHKAPGAEIELKAFMESGKIKVTYNAEIPDRDLLTIALVLNKTSSRVASGENKGKYLQHVNVVTDLIQLNKDDKSAVTFNTAKDFKPGNYKIIAFLQNRKNTEITAAVETFIQ